MADLRDYAVAFDAGMKWLEEHGVHVETGILTALARVMVIAVDEARIKRQQQDH